MTQFPARLVIQSIKAPMLLIDPDQRVSIQNAAMTELLTFDFTGRNYVTALRQPAVLDAIDRARDEMSQTIARYVTRSGQTDQVYEVSIIPESDHLLVMFEDQSAEQATHTLRRDFVANVSHELRTPLTALLGFIETLQGPAKNDPPAQQRFLGIMAMEADRLRRLVDDLLSLSRVEDIERRRPTLLVDLGNIAQQTCALLGPLAEAAGTHLSIDIGADIPLVPGDDAQLQQVLNNLVGNAIKYGATPEGICVSISAPAYETTLQQTCVRMTVQDFGEGIPAHHLVRLTERFYRVDGHRDREMGGTGLGLAIVKHIANRHRGRLHFESVVGQGTSVSILLPFEIL